VGLRFDAAPESATRTVFHMQPANP
jgi:hypothetical protein